ncbi:TraR/DksA family transcriptional regulator [Azohydromonas australica]|uniref:TraR/DksA family transcriptional regulator n=1 Tax=Azohydromonas australica TaxID=364039 RepID=UPI0003F5A216|nr:TraR/DksA family transcriptional regulator [Azohydromonas australica]
MSALSPEQLQALQEQLSHRESELGAELRDFQERREERPSAQGPLVDDQVAQGEERIRTGVEHIEMERDQLELRDIDDARARIAEGSYGECVDCGCDIPYERLHAQPTAARCVDCQERWEKTHETVPRYTA